MAMGKIIPVIDHDIRAARMALAEDIEAEANIRREQIALLIAKVDQLRIDVDRPDGASMKKEQTQPMSPPAQVIITWEEFLKLRDSWAGSVHDLTVRINNARDEIKQLRDEVRQLRTDIEQLGTNVNDINPKLEETVSSG
jgi:ubiquinone biosynthesis protein UbiJ